MLRHLDPESGRVAFTPELEERVLQLMREMRRVIKSGQAPGRRWVGYKCKACGFKRRCWK